MSTLAANDPKDISRATAPLNASQSNSFSKAPLSFGKWGFTPATALSPTAQETWGDALDAQNSTFTDLLDMGEQKKRDILRSRELTPRGHTTALTALHDKIEKGITDSAAKTEKSLRDHLAYHLKNAPVFPEPKVNDPATEMRRGERRQFLRKMDPVMLNAALNAAAKTGSPDDLELLHTVLSDPAPAGHRIVDSKRGDELKQAYLVGKAGDAHFQPVEDIRQMTAILAANKGLALKHIGRSPAISAARQAEADTSTAHKPDGSVAATVTKA